MSHLAASQATCFGKLPTHGDFVKGPGQHHLIGMLDKWASSAMERLSDDPRWKTEYDRATALDFVFVGPGSRVSIVGHLRPSTDASGRRFPFMTVATVERGDTLMFRCAPAGLARAFAAMRDAAERAAQGADVNTLLAGLDCAADFDLALHSDPLGEFVRHTSIEALAGLLGDGTSPDGVRCTILAIGLLLRPVLGNPTLPIDKEMAFPLPGDGRYRHIVAGLWLYLVSAFLRRGNCELQVLISGTGDTARLVIGFNGASPRTLHAALAPGLCREGIVSLDAPEWIEAHHDLCTDYGIAKLSAYLSQPGITLEAAITTFREVFLGE